LRRLILDSEATCRYILRANVLELLITAVYTVLNVVVVDISVLSALVVAIEGV
jgi:hypothetical protein